MNADLKRLIDRLTDAGVLTLAVAVQQDLDDEEVGSAALSQLTPAAAEAFLASLAKLHAQLDRAADLPSSVAVARGFLDVLLQAEVFDTLISENVLNTGVRLGLDEILGWFKGSFNLASLVGLRFEYVSERKEVQHTETGSVETSRTIRLGVGAKS